MCMGGGGYSGPSSEQLVAQEAAAKDRATAEINRINAEKEAAKEAENAKVVADQASIANTDAARRVRNRTLLAGLGAEEDNASTFKLEDPKSASAKKAKRATLLGVL